MTQASALKSLLTPTGKVRIPIVNGDLVTTDPGAWALVGSFAAFGDWGMSFLNLGFFGEIWATIPFGIVLGLALLAFSLVQAALTDWLISLAVRQAERRG